MPKKLPPTDTAAIVAMLESGIAPKDIAPQIPCSYDVVCKIRRNIKNWGSIQAPKMVHQGRPVKILAKYGNALIQHLKEKPSLDLEEMVYFLYDEFDIIVSESTVSRYLKKKKINRKKLEARARERSQFLREDWLIQLAGWQADQLLFLDESACNEKTGHRKYGWAPIGTTPYEYLPAKRSERWSILPCYSVDGYVAWEVIQGSYNTDRFNSFVKDKVIPLTSPFPGPRSVLICDNAIIHKSQELVNMCKEAGIILAFLPPYSCDFNPIEISFAELKAWYKKNQTLATSFCTDFSAFIKLGIEVMSQKSCNHFRACHIGVHSILH